MSTMPHLARLATRHRLREVNAELVELMATLEPADTPEATFAGIREAHQQLLDARRALEDVDTRTVGPILGFRVSTELRYQLPAPMCVHDDGTEHPADGPDADGLYGTCSQGS